VDVIYLAPGDISPKERHTRVVMRMGQATGMYTGFFYDSSDASVEYGRDSGWGLSEAVARATRFAEQRSVGLVIVKARHR
jgi:hypothetical protein